MQNSPPTAASIDQNALQPQVMFLILCLLHFFAFEERHSCLTLFICALNAQLNAEQGPFLWKLKGIWEM